MQALSAMVKMELPHVNILTKMDICPDKVRMMGGMQLGRGRSVGEVGSYGKGGRGGSRKSGIPHDPPPMRPAHGLAQLPWADRQSATLWLLTSTRGPCLGIC